MKIRENKGWPHVFTLKDGSTFRLFPHEVKPLDSSNVSPDIENAVTMGLVSVYEESPKAVPAVEEHTEQVSKKTPKESK